MNQDNVVMFNAVDSLVLSEVCRIHSLMAIKTRAWDEGRLLIDPSILDCQYPSDREAFVASLCIVFDLRPWEFVEDNAIGPDDLIEDFLVKSIVGQVVSSVFGSSDVNAMLVANVEGLLLGALTGYDSQFRSDLTRLGAMLDGHAMGCLDRFDYIGASNASVRRASDCGITFSGIAGRVRNRPMR